MIAMVTDETGPTNWPEPSGTVRGRFEDDSRKGRGRGGGGSAVRPGRRSRRWRGALLGASAGRWGRWPDPFGTPAGSFGGPCPEGSVQHRVPGLVLKPKTKHKRRPRPAVAHFRWWRVLPRYLPESSDSCSIHPALKPLSQATVRSGLLTTPRTPPGKSGLGSLPFAFPAEQMREIDSRMR